MEKSNAKKKEKERKIPFIFVNEYIYICIYKKRMSIYTYADCFLDLRSMFVK